MSAVNESLCIIVILLPKIARDFVH